jgi:hypothetical protein
MKNKILLVLFFAVCWLGVAQENDSISKNRKHAIGLSIGTGVAFDYSYKFTDRFSVTVRYNVFQYEIKDLKQTIDGEDLLIGADIDFKNIDVLFSYYPFKTSFKLIGGLGYFTNRKLTIPAVFAEGVSIGEVEFTPEELGEITIDMEWKQIMPYVGIGFGRAVPNKRLGFGIDIGTYLGGEPDVALDATGLLAGTVDQEEVLNNGLSELKFIPYFSFRLSYSLF